MKLFSKDGIEMMEVRSIAVVGEQMVIKGKMMGTMAATIHVAPEELWNAAGLFSVRTILCLPLLLAKGWRRGRRSR